MTVKELETLVQAQRHQGRHDAYIRNALKEYLQVYVLSFIYTSPRYKQSLLFTGGTCLRHFYGLERLSEDIDFDYIGSFSPQDFRAALMEFFTSKQQYPRLRATLKQQGNQIRLKFPILKHLGLARERESDLLYVKIDISPLPSTHYAVQTTSKSSFGLNYAAKHYDLPSLMAGKLHAILTRRYQKGATNAHAVKGRDYFDLLWFVKAGVTPNLHRLTDMLAEAVDLKTVEQRIDTKVATFVKTQRGAYLADMAPLIQNPDILETYINNYQEEYLRYKAQSFAATVRLAVICQQCHRGFTAGMTMERSTFENLTALNNIHQCPLCGSRNTVKKTDYVMR